MYKLKSFSLFMVFLLFITIYSPTVTAINLKGTPHDLSGGGSALKICNSCHISNSADVQNKLLSDDVNKKNTEMQNILGLSSTLFCAQCHDGTISMKNIDNASEDGNSNMDSMKNEKTGLDNHPVNADYPYTKEGFKSNPTVKLYGSNHDKVKCNTCHDPHKAGTGSFLRKKKDLCKDCHEK